MGMDDLAAKAVQQAAQARYAQTFSKGERDKRLAQGRKTARFFDGKEHPVLGRHLGTIPLNEFYLLKMKYGVEAMSDPEFMDWMRRRVLKPEGLTSYR